MQKKKIISTYLSLANYVADTIAIEIKKNYKNLKDQKVSISVNDEIIEHGLGENVLGSPILALKWLLNELLEFKIPLKKGHFVSTGTVTKPIPIKKGDIVKADYSDLGNFQIILN